MRRDHLFIMLAITGWALAAGIYFGTRSANPNPTQDLNPDPTPAPETLAATTPQPSAPAPLLQWSPAHAQGDLLPNPTNHAFDAHLRGTARILPAADAAGIPALHFDGTGDNALWRGQPQNCGLSFDQPLPQPFTQLSIEAWVRKPRAGWMPVLYRDQWDEESGFGLYMEWSEGKAAFGHYGNDSGVQSNSVVQDDHWHHIVGTLGPAPNGSFRYRIYVDGQPDGEQLGPWAIAPSPPNAGTLLIACPNASGAEHPFQGDLGPLALFNTELTPDQIKARYDSQKPR